MRSSSFGRHVLEGQCPGDPSRSMVQLLVPRQEQLPLGAQQKLHQLGVWQQLQQLQQQLQMDASSMRGSFCKPATKAEILSASEAPVTRAWVFACSCWISRWLLFSFD
mmetsp:Transcript_69669/g.226775  ORF Transcript_69669/g.226775 Transcript_69669/m.226775 type:complete len:108 (-) Transcript_69669:116-439(-)